MPYNKHRDPIGYYEDRIIRDLDRTIRRRQVRMVIYAFVNILLATYRSIVMPNGAILPAKAGKIWAESARKRTYRNDSLNIIRLGKTVCASSLNTLKSGKGIGCILYYLPHFPWCAVC